MIDKIVEYIRQNRSIYTPEAITEKLLSEGYNQGDIDSAWSQVRSMDKLGLTDKPRLVEQWQFWVTVIIVVGVCLGATKLLLPGYTPAPNSRSTTGNYEGLRCFLATMVPIALLEISLFIRSRFIATAIRIGLLVTYIIFPIPLLIIVLGSCGLGYRG